MPARPARSRAGPRRPSRWSPQPPGAGRTWRHCRRHAPPRASSAWRPWSRRSSRRSSSGPPPRRGCSLGPSWSRWRAISNGRSSSPCRTPPRWRKPRPPRLLSWTHGKALVATGSLFDDVEEGGVSFKIGQANNAALYPGLGLGAIVCRAAKVTDEMILAAAKAVGGQAALFLSRSSAEVHIIIRGETLDTSMSRYLIDQIERDPRITVTLRTQVTALLGTDQLEGVHLLHPSRQQTSALAVRGLFVFIGARPATRWLAGQLAQDNRGFLLS